MTSVSTRILKDQLSSYLHRAENGERIVVLRGGKPVAVLVSLDDVHDQDEAMCLAALEARDLVTRPRKTSSEGAFQHPPVAARGKLASQMVVEDRR